MADVSNILNYRRLTDLVSLSGQPTEDQLVDLQAAGVSHVVNLGPHSNDGALADEAGSVAALGINYIYIPVDFDNPIDANFSEFCDALDRLEGERVHVHCIYNARVTAFFYRLSKTDEELSQSEVFAMMDGIWRPGGV
ncbi:MAG: protein tyrosine phosphatase family protein [Boseongicola sp.]|nr:protein tyrosine phosphatase family protein [Boseongicola sp.]MDD9979647.1 protein tyrosine phosphatase family protein [Boseongicola sp.]